MENKVLNLKKIMNEFIIYRMEEELNLLSCLIKQNEDKINNKKININFFYKNKLEGLNKEYEEKEKIYKDFITKVESKRILEQEFTSILDNLFIDDESMVKKYCLFLQCYFTSLYEMDNLEERNKYKSLKDIQEELKLDENILEFIKKSIKKNMKVVDSKNMFNLLINQNMTFDIDTFYPLSMDLKDEDIEVENSLLCMQMVNDCLCFYLPYGRKIIDMNIDTLKKALFSYLLIRDYIKIYSLKNYDDESEFISSLLKQKNEYEILVLEKQVKDNEKEEKLILLNKVIEELA